MRTPSDIASRERTIVLCIAQAVYAGRVPVAPGTAGSLAGVVLCLLLDSLGPVGYFISTCAVAVIGGWAAGRAELLLGAKDHPSIVIDEVAGMLVALFLAPAGWGYVAAAFLLFRFFDILKPWPIGRLQHLPGGAGVMLDDIGAGLLANAVMQCAAYLTA